MAVIELTKQNFQSEVAESKEKVLIDFWASWCGPCRMVSPIVDEIAEESPAGVKVCKVNVAGHEGWQAGSQLCRRQTQAVYRENDRGSLIKHSF